MKGFHYLFVALAFAATIQSSCAEHIMGNGQSLMNTNIALVGADQSNMQTRSRDDVVVDPSNLIEQASGIDSGLEDIEEDDEDRFITSRGGKIRPMYKEPTGEEDWANEAPVGTLGRLLLRKKRCYGGDDDDDDDGDANRSRSSRRSRTKRVKKIKKVKRKKAKKNKNKGTTTTVTRKIIQNGQVVSQTTENQTAVKQQVVSAQPVVVEKSAPVVHTVTSQHTIQVHPPQTSAHVQTLPEVVQTQPAIVQQTVPAQTVVQTTR